MDPYVYEGSNVLINKFGIRDEQELIELKTQLLLQMRYIYLVIYEKR